MLIMSKKMGKIAPLLLLCVSLTFARTIPSAAILPFGRGNNNNKEEEQKRAEQKRPPPRRNRQPQDQHDPRKPPPPPPPPRGREEGEQQPLQNGESKDGTQEEGEQYDNVEYPPQSQFWAPGPFDGQFDGYGGLPPPPPGWMGPPQDWGQQQQQQQQVPWQQQQPDMHQELDAFIARETDLLSELQNVTAKMAAYEQRDDLHMRQLDVLTERVIDVEATAASERTSLIEYQTNCTELDRTVALLQDGIEEWTQRCQNLTIQHEKDGSRLTKMKTELKERNREVEDLATIIESARLDSERDRYLVERNSRKKKRGFFAWVFGISSREEEDEDTLQVSRWPNISLCSTTDGHCLTLQKECTGIREIHLASCSAN